MGFKHTYPRDRCHKCGKYVPRNWMIRHLKDNCQSGNPDSFRWFKPGQRARKLKMEYDGKKIKKMRALGDHQDGDPKILHIEFTDGTSLTIHGAAESLYGEVWFEKDKKPDRNYTKEFPID